MRRKLKRVVLLEAELLAAKNREDVLKGLLADARDPEASPARVEIQLHGARIVITSRDA